MRLSACRARAARSACVILALVGLGCSGAPGLATDAGPEATDQQMIDAAAGDGPDVRTADAGATDGPQPNDGARPADRAKADQPSSGFPYYAINHVLCTGQSLSVGSLGFPAISKTQPYDNKMFNTGPVSSLTFKTPTGFAPLAETYVARPDAGPQETMSSGMANLITKLARDDFASLPPPRSSHDLLVSCHGVGGTPYDGLKKGTTPYQNGMKQVQAGMSLAAAQKLSYIVRAVTVVHGESDDCLKTNCGSNDYNASYDQDLITWQADYERDAKALTKQTAPIPMFQSQISSWTKMAKRATSHLPGLQLQASLAKPGKIIMVGPKYFLPYSDGVHLKAEGYRRLGEYYAKAYRRVVLEGKDFLPLYPLDAKLSGKTIAVTFHVPVPPLALDTTLVSTATHFGFEYTDNSGSPAGIAGVKVSSPTTVEISLSKAPSASATKTLFYAFTGVANAAAGPQTGPRGNLRDSDTTLSRDGKTKLYNWAVHFAKAVHY